MSADRLLDGGFRDGRCRRRLRLLAAPAETLHLVRGLAARLGDTVGCFHGFQATDRGTAGLARVVCAEELVDNALSPREFADVAHAAARPDPVAAPAGVC